MKTERIATENGEKTIFRFSGSTIIYCQTKKMTTDIVNLLRSIGVKCDQYHAGLTIQERKTTQIDFINDQLDVII
jgi:superfamily II DNA helicase RecQ